MLIGWKVGRGGGLVASVLTFNSNSPSLIPAEAYNFDVKLLLKRTKINKKEAEPFLATIAFFYKIWAYPVLFFV